MVLIYCDFFEYIKLWVILYFRFLVRDEFWVKDLVLIFSWFNLNKFLYIDIYIYRYVYEIIKLRLFES